MQRKPDVYNSIRNNIRNNIAISGKQFIFIAVTAIIAITVCSKSSPIYPFNDWVDANCFMTVGKSMLHGLVPYRDLYEQKGPLLYMLHALAALISETTFIGVYFLEILAAVVFLLYSFKTMKLYQQSVSIVLIPILAAAVYSAHSFCHGDSAEELCLPLVAFAIYLAVKMIRQEKLPTWREFMAVGVTFAFVLWIKFTMLGFYFGWFFAVVLQLVRQHDIKKLPRIILWIAIGVLVPTVPILIYFGMNHAISDLWVVYFYNNLFYHSVLSKHSVILSLAINLLRGTKHILTTNLIPAVLIGIGLLALLKKRDRTEFYAYFMMVVFTFLLVYIGGRSAKYYSLIFCAFVPIGVLTVCQTLQVCLFSRICVGRRFAAGMICAGSIIFAFIMCNNTYLLRYSKSDLPQYQFAEIIAKRENATLLNYGFLDGGFYTTTGIVPNCRFFCNLNIKLDEIMETQNKFVEQGLIDFVVTRNKELESNRYECAAVTTFYLEGDEYTYSLYQRIP